MLIVYKMEREEWLPGGYPNRTMCGVLEEMRQCYKHLNFAPLPGLIEEAQTLANRMESGLGDKQDYYALAKILRTKLLLMRGDKSDNAESD